jgi:hypothetical protein
MICSSKPEEPSFGHLSTMNMDNLSIAPMITIMPQGGALQTTSTISRFDTKITPNFAPTDTSKEFQEGTPSTQHEIIADKSFNKMKEPHPSNITAIIMEVFNTWFTAPPAL